MAETSSSSGRKRAKVDGPLASSSASSRKFDGAARFKAKFQSSWTKNGRLLLLFLVHPLSSDVRCATKFAAVLIKGNLM